MQEIIIPLNPDLEQAPLYEVESPLYGKDMGTNTFVRAVNVGAVKHRNYIGYLELCYANHYSPVVRPDFIWYGLLCELANMVKETPDAFRKFFTTSDSKTELTVFSGSLDKLPLEKIVELFKSRIPSGVENYLPVFSTSTPDSTEAFYAAFADAVSPFYNYSMMLCGFPSMVIQGTPEDWNKLADAWKNLSSMKIFDGASTSDKKFAAKVQTTLDNCANTMATGVLVEEHWKGMLKVENCGSGHQRMVKGWITSLFRTKPEVGYSENFSSHISKVDYKQLDTGIEYSAYYGLFSSKIDGHILRPSYGTVITRKATEEELESARKNTVTTFKIYSTPVVSKSRKMIGGFSTW